MNITQRITTVTHKLQTKTDEIMLVVGYNYGKSARFELMETIHTLKDDIALYKKLVKGQEEVITNLNQQIESYKNKEKALEGLYQVSKEKVALQSERITELDKERNKYKLYCDQLADMLKAYETKLIN